MSVIPLPTTQRRSSSPSTRSSTGTRDAPDTRATYTETLRQLRETAGDQVPAATLTPEIYE